MGGERRRSIALVALGMVLGAGLQLVGPALAAPAAQARRSASLEAAQVYTDNCASCHGANGRGDGPVTQAAIWETIEGIDRGRKPRDYTREWFRYGDSKDAIVRTITEGSPGTAMNGFKGVYSPEVIAELARIVLSFRGSLTNATIARQYPERLPAELRPAATH